MVCRLRPTKLAMYGVTLFPVSPVMNRDVSTAGATIRTRLLAPLASREPSGACMRIGVDDACSFVGGCDRCALASVIDARNERIETEMVVGAGADGVPTPLS